MKTETILYMHQNSWKEWRRISTFFCYLEDFLITHFCSFQLWSCGFTRSQCCFSNQYFLSVLSHLSLILHFKKPFFFFLNLYFTWFFLFWGFFNFLFSIHYYHIVKWFYIYSLSLVHYITCTLFNVSPFTLCLVIISVHYPTKYCSHIWSSSHVPCKCLVTFCCYRLMSMEVEMYWLFSISSNCWYSHPEKKKNYVFVTSS